MDLSAVEGWVAGIAMWGGGAGGYGHAFRQQTQPEWPPWYRLEACLRVGHDACRVCRNRSPRDLRSRSHVGGSTAGAVAASSAGALRGRAAIATSLGSRRRLKAAQSNTNRLSPRGAPGSAGSSRPSLTWGRPGPKRPFKPCSSASVPCLHAPRASSAADPVRALACSRRRARDRP